MSVGRKLVHNSVGFDMCVVSQVWAVVPLEVTVV